MMLELTKEELQIAVFLIHTAMQGMGSLILKQDQANLLSLHSLFHKLEAAAQAPPKGD